MDCPAKRSSPLKYRSLYTYENINFFLLEKARVRVNKLLLLGKLLKWVPLLSYSEFLHNSITIKDESLVTHR